MNDAPGPGALGRVLLVVALGLAAWGMAPTFEGPYARSWLGHNGARYGQIARNYARHGLTHQGGAPLLDAEVVGPHGSTVYGHHPPGFTMALALVFEVTGVGEAPARAFAGLGTLLSLVLLAWLVGRVSDPWTGGLAALLCAALPMTQVYGAHVEVQGSWVVASSLAVWLAYARWREGASPWPLVLAALVASAWDWSGLYAPMGCALHALVRGRRGAGALGVAATLALFGGWYLWLGTRPGMGLDTVVDAAGVRGWGGLFLEGVDYATYREAWWADTTALMPLWPLSLVVTLAVAWGRLGRSPPGPFVGGGGPSLSGGSAGPERPLRAPDLAALLLLPPLAHAALFPAGALMHSYWLFALPPALAAGLALAAAPLRRVVGLALAVAMAGAGLASYGAALPPANTIPALVGQTLGAMVPPAEAVLTNFDTNLLLPGDGDEYHLKWPEVNYYSDRIVRGGISGPEDLAEGLRRRPDAVWFLATPWPRPPGDALLAEVEARSPEPPRILSDDPPVRLYRLER